MILDLFSSALVNDRLLIEGNVPVTLLSLDVEQCAWIEQLAITGERICLQCFAILHQ